MKKKVVNFEVGIIPNLKILISCLFSRVGHKEVFLFFCGKRTSCMSAHNALATCEFAYETRQAQLVEPKPGGIIILMLTIQVTLGTGELEWSE